MPIQWSGTIDSPAKLASVIQGEAGSNPVAQFAVASTMWNRMSNFGPYLGGGSMDVASVVTPSQFNGFNSSPNSTAQGFANDLWGGNAPQGGDTGNATFFAAPSNSNASWANPNTASGAGLFSNGANIGGNYFTDQLGPPSNNFQPPVYGAASSPSYAMPDFTSGDPYWSNQGAANIAPTATDATGSFNGAGGLPFFAQGGG
ncbi:MAG: hypothetical protein P4M15_08605, partial [Alphaproteobacteria bacterium]|nr:hypothetical protein [Alphaproteobacteria bacterium]